MNEPKHSHSTLAAAVLASDVCAMSASQHWPAAEDHYMPDPQLTPGATMNVSAAECCQPGYAGGARDVSEGQKRGRLCPLWHQKAQARSVRSRSPNFLGARRQ
jgi:hypothetical protein